MKKIQDPKAEKTNTTRIARGLSYADAIRRRSYNDIRIASRDIAPPFIMSKCIGFRVLKRKNG